MEGRRPPPKAEHPFPNNPDMTKFWGTPYAKAFFKSFGVFCLIYGAWAGANIYLERDRTGVLGINFRMTKEQFKKRIGLMEDATFMKSRFQFPLDFNFDRQKLSSNPEMRFDDGVEFVAPTVTVAGVMRFD